MTHDDKDGNEHERTEDDGRARRTATRAISTETGKTTRRRNSPIDSKDDRAAPTARRQDGKQRKDAPPSVSRGGAMIWMRR